AGVKHERRLKIFAICGVDRVQHSIAGDKIDWPPPLRIGGADDRRVAAAAWPQKPEVNRINSLLDLPFVGPMLVPEHLPRIDIEGVEVVRDAGHDAHLFAALGSFQLTDYEHR